MSLMASLATYVILNKDYNVNRQQIKWTTQIVTLLTSYISPWLKHTPKYLNMKVELSSNNVSTLLWKIYYIICIYVFTCIYGIGV